jgi:hypothetical protein
MRPATRACRSFGLAHAIISRWLQSFVNSKNWAVPAIQILASGVLLTEHLNFELFSIFKLGQADPIDIPARRSSHAGAPCAGGETRRFNPAGFSLILRRGCRPAWVGLTESENEQA